MLNFQLSPCKLCGGTSQEFEVSQQKNQLWVATIFCGGCEISFSPYYASATSEDALASLAQRWNHVPGSGDDADSKRVEGPEVRLLDSKTTHGQP